MVKAGNMALKRRTGEILKNVKKVGKTTDPCTNERILGISTLEFKKNFIILQHLNCVEMHQ